MGVIIRRLDGLTVPRWGVVVLGYRVAERAVLRWRGGVPGVGEVFFILGRVQKRLFALLHRGQSVHEDRFCFEDGVRISVVVWVLGLKWCQCLFVI